MKKIFLLCCSFLSFWSISQKEIVSEQLKKNSAVDKVVYSENKINPRLVIFNTKNSIGKSTFFSWFNENLKPQKELIFRELSSETDNLGITHIKYEQTFDNITIQDAILIVHIKGEKVLGFNGNYLTEFNNSNNKSYLTEKAAFSKVLETLNRKSYEWEIEPNSASIPKGKLIYIKNASGIYSKAFQFNIYSHEPLSRDLISVDVATGEIISSINLIHSIDAIGSAKTKYSGTQTITSDSYNGKYRLRESGRGNGIETYNMQKGISFSNAVDFWDSNNIWDTINPEQDEIATDVHWGTEMTYDYFKSKFNRNSIDNKGFTLKNYVHYSTNFVNAFWDGEKMIYGDGNASTPPIVALDVIGHEITHGFTTNTSKLNLTNESGALNEGLSDIFACAIERHTKPNLKNWTLGEDVGLIDRDLSNPNKFNKPDTYLGTYWVASSTTPTQANDFGGIHTNATVIGHWFYLLTEGGVGTNDLGNNYSVIGIGIEKAEQIVYRMQTTYLTSSSNYNDARIYAIQAATDLFGACSPEVQSVTNAMYAIGVGGIYTNEVKANFETDFTTLCRVPIAVNFKNKSDNGADYIWHFGDGTTSTEVNPTHTYSKFGEYSVKLIVNSEGCGKDSLLLTNFLSIQDTNPCNEKMPSNSQLILEGCSGNLYDEGGTNNYSDLSYSITTIAPKNAAQVTLKFSEFNYENNSDYLRIYDGNSTSSKLIGFYTGNTLPNGGTITSTNGAITLEQITNGGNNQTGFILNWTCSNPVEKPISNFYTSDTISCSGVVHFYDASKNGVKSWRWDFGDDMFSFEQNPTHTYANDGTYDISLITTNDIGQDTLTKIAHVIVSKLKPIIDSVFYTCDNDSIIMNLNTNGEILWFEGENDSISIFTGNPFVRVLKDSINTLYVENSLKFNSAKVEPSQNTLGTGGFYNQARAHYLIFNSYREQELVSVKVYSAAAGIRTINLRGIDGTIIESKSINIPAGESRIVLNFKLPVQDGLKLEGPFFPNLYRNLTGANFPYTIPGVISITGTSATDPKVYYYFYDWEIKPLTCVTARKEIRAEILGKPNSKFSYINNGLDYTFTLDQKNYSSEYLWIFGDGDSSTTNNPTHSFLKNGSYEVKLIAKNDCYTDSTTKLVNVSLGVNENDQTKEVKIYPNPFNNNISIELNPELIQKIDLIYFENNTGQVIQKQVVNSTLLEIPLNFENGIYFVKLVDKNHKIIHITKLTRLE